MTIGWEIVLRCGLWNVISGKCLTFEKLLGLPVVYNFSADGKFIIGVQNKLE